MDALGRNKRKPSSIYTGISAFNQNIGGSFNGETLLLNTQLTEAIMVPKIDYAIGKKISLGVKAYDIKFIGQNDLGIELSYGWSGHAASWKDLAIDVSYQEIDADFKSYFKPGKRFQPYLNLGFYESILSVKKGSTDSFGNIGDAIYTSFGFNLGGGIAIKLSRHLSISGGITFKFSPFYTVRGVREERGTIGGSFNSSSVSTDLDIQFNF